MRITIIDIMKRLIVSEQQVLSAIYSGALPNPDEHSEWDSEYIEPFLINWETRINNRNKDKSK